MRKNSSLMYAILGGVITCFVCVGMIFLYPSKETSNLKGNNSSLPNYEEEINLGDTVKQCVNSSYHNYYGCEGVSCSGLSEITCTLAKSDASTGSHNCCAYVEVQVTPSPTPTPVGPVVVTSTPTPAPTISGVTPTPTTGLSTPKPCSSYTSSSTCANANCYWNNNTCSNPTPTPTASGSTPTPTATTCTYANQAACEAANPGRECWKVSSCYEVKACSQYPPYNCPSYCYRTSTACTSPTATPTPTPKVTATPTPKPCSSYGSAGDCRNANCYWDYSGSGQCISPTPTPVPSETPTPTPKVCTTPNTYWNGTDCIYCPDAYKATVAIPQCHINIPAGSYLVGGTTQILSCTAGSYSTGGVYGLSGGCISGDCAIGSCHSCGSGKTGPVGAKSEKECYEKTDPSDCSVTVTTSATKVSYGSHFNAHVSVSGKGCNGQTMSVGVTRGTLPDSNRGTYNVSDGSGFNFTVTVTKQSSCKSSTSFNAKLSGGASGGVTVQTIVDWHQVSTDICVSDATIGGMTSRKAAEDAGKDYYYIVKNGLEKCSSQGLKTADKWVRGCGGGGGTPEKVPYCYIDDDGGYHWTTDPGSSWKKVEGITSADNCREDEDPACYTDKDGKYVWGKYAKSDGYTLITSIKDEASCKEPTEEYACYKNSEGDYKWTTTAPEGYTKVDDIKTPAECAPPEEPACYLHGSEFVWGKYEKVTGYIKLEDVDSEDKCKAPETDACYEGPDGNYVWGRYGDDPNYTLVPSVTELSQCTKDVPTPPTATSVSKIVYVFMAVLMACGIGFITYSSVIKKAKQED